MFRALLAWIFWVSIAHAQLLGVVDTQKTFTSQLISQTNYTAGSLGSGDSDARSSTADYINSSFLVASAGTGAARFDYSMGSAGGWLVEAAATNLILNSQVIGGTYWGATNVTATTNSVTAPDSGATTTGSKIVPTSSNASHREYQSEAGLTSGGTYSACAYIQPNGYNYGGVSIYNTSASSGIYVNVNLTSGGVVQSGAFGSGWTLSGTYVSPVAYNNYYRVCIWGALATGTTSVYTAINVYSTSSQTFTSTFAGDTTSAVNAWGFQFTAGAGWSTYIVTTTVAVTRAADTAANGNWWNGSSGNYLMVESTSESTGTTSRASYCASGCTGASFSAPTGVWIRRICQYNATTAGAIAANADAARSNGTACS